MNKLILAISTIILSLFINSLVSVAEATQHINSNRHVNHKHRSVNSDGKLGVASWYGRQFHGKKTANGERYDMFAMTAAHNSLPLSSYVEVTNLKNKRSVVVRINDRGPFHGNRILDLSYAAAKELGINQSGTTSVQIRPLFENSSLAELSDQPHG